jgi:glycine dehydrogenase subunit 1
MGAMHMSLLGPEGLAKLAQRNMAACQLAKQKLSEIPSINLPHSGNSHYNEFVLELPGSSSECISYLDTQGLIGGFDLSNWYPENENWLLVSFSDQTTIKDIDLLVAHLSVWAASMKGVTA